MTAAPTLDERKIERLIELGGESLVLDLTRNFLESAPGKIASVRDALSRKDLEGVGQHAHALASGAGILGALELVEQCQAVERLARDEDSANIPPAVEELETAYVRARERLQASGLTGDA